MNSFKINGGIASYESLTYEEIANSMQNQDKINVKDFYDIYQLHGGKYSHQKLTAYFGRMLQLRGKISLGEASTIHLNQQFIREHNDIWESTREKYAFAFSFVLTFFT